MFNNFSDIDRQTELDDDDGSLTGLVKTISVNQDPFFNAPYSTLECGSDAANGVPTDPTQTAPGTANTSPYDYVSTVIFPNCGSTATCAGDGTAGTNWNWSEDCANNTCYGVPLYRELKTGTENSSRPTLSGIKMMGESFFQRNTLTVNNGVYYMDTTVSKDKQIISAPEISPSFRRAPIQNPGFTTSFSCSPSRPPRKPTTSMSARASNRPTTSS